MNTSTNTKGAGLLHRGMAGALLAMTITATAAALAATSHADDGPPTPSFGGPAHTGAGCKTEPFGFLGSQRRTLCDGPIASDGSWSRERTIWAPAHLTPYSCTSHSYSSLSPYTSCYGGDFVNERLISNETYPVRPETVLPDEPGHLG
jgi:hypothetical protein